VRVYKMILDNNRTFLFTADGTSVFGESYRGTHCHIVDHSLELLGILSVF